MYYEIHGSGHPLVQLHGAFGFIEARATVLPTLTKTHQGIAIELEGHGHTHDLDRPLTYEQMAEDTALLLKQLKIKDADFFGYSMGGTVALGVAIRYPELVRKLAIYGSCTGKPKETYEPETHKQYQSLSTDFALKQLKEPYDKMAPDPTRWPVLVTKIKNMGRDFKFPPVAALVLAQGSCRRSLRSYTRYEILLPSDLCLRPGIGDNGGEQG